MKSERNYKRHADRSGFERLFLAAMAGFILFAAGAAMRSKLDAASPNPIPGVRLLHPPLTGEQFAEFLESSGGSAHLSSAEYAAAIELFRNAGDRPAVEAMHELSSE